MALPGYDNKSVPGIDRTNAGLGGHIPQQTITGYTTRFYEQLFHSVRDIALLLDKTFRAGYGCLPIGTVVAKDSNTDKMIPFTSSNTGEISQEDPGRVFLLTDLTSGGTSGEFDVEMLESYKLDAGDTIQVMDSDTGTEEATIASIDRDSSNIKATVTLNSGVSGNFTTANNANVFLKGGDTAVYIADADTDTGAGEYAKGAVGSVVLSNAILNKSVVKGMKGSATSDLGNVSTDGTYYVLK